MNEPNLAPLKVLLPEIRQWANEAAHQEHNKVGDYLITIGVTWGYMLGACNQGIIPFR
jgi:hypothetical protein